jgi:hypothetical protein
MGGQPLTERSWALQEQMLVTRMIYFTDSEMKWECKSQLRCECMVLDHNDLSEMITAYHKSLASNSMAEKSEVWYHIANLIMVQDPTFKEDLLPAISRLARQIQDSDAGTYVAGLWLDDLREGFIWDSDDDRSLRTHSYKAPSWSWASLERCSDIQAFPKPYKYKFKRKSERTWARVLKANCTASRKDPLDAIFSSYIKISAPLLEMRWISTLPWLDPETLLVDRLSALMYLDLEITLRVDLTLDFDLRLSKDQTLHCLLIGERIRRNRSQPCSLVLQEKSSGCKDVCERAGTFHIEQYLSGADKC